jgi:FtsP/CotA-like multicopper oxidase with cupredoxin domain
VLVPDITPNLTGLPKLPAAFEAGWKDAMVSLPGQVLTFVAKWEGGWRGAAGECAQDNLTCFEPVTAGPYVWHCHINSHEDSEMMRSSLVVK